MEVIHVVGMSAVGKASLMRRLADPKEVDLRLHFKIVGTTRQYLDPTHGNFSECDDDGQRIWSSAFQIVDDARDEIADHLLHKWQYGTKCIPKSLRSQLPVCHQRVIALWLPREVEDERRRKRGMPMPSDESWEKSIFPVLKSLAELGITITVVDASGNDYPQRSSW